MRLKLRLLGIMLLFIPLYLDVASCGPRPKYDVNIYTYENGEFVIQATEKLSRYSRLNMREYDIPEVDGYTFLGWFEPWLENENIFIDTYIDVYLEEYELLKPEVDILIHFDEAIYPILVQTEKLETYREKTKYYVYYYCPVLSSLEKNVYTIDGWSYESMYPNVKWGDTLADILPLPEILEGYTFVGYSNIPITPKMYQKIGIPEANRLSLTTVIDHKFPTDNRFSLYEIYAVYQKN